MGNPIFRFTLYHDPGPMVDPFPPLSEWLNYANGVTNWTLGAVPEVTLAGTGPFPPNSKRSGTLYTDYNFIPGEEYVITLAYDVAFNNPFGSNPRSLFLRIFDEDFNVLFENAPLFPGNPGGSGTISITFTATDDCTKVGISANSGSNVTLQITSIANFQGPVARTLEISEPEGWLDAKCSLERDKDYHSLVDLFEGEFTFYGSNGRDVDGGIDFIRDIDRSYGPDTTMLLQIEVSFNSGVTFEDMFSGQLDLENLHEFPNNKMHVPIIPNEFWTTFMNRKSTPVDLQAETDIDEASITPIDFTRLYLPSQKVRYNGHYRWQDSITYAFEDYNQEYVLQLDWDENIVDDLKKFNIPRVMIQEEGNDGVNPGEIIVGIFEAPYDGDYTFDVGITAAFYNEDDAEWNRLSAGFNFYLHRSDETNGPDSEFDKANHTSGSDDYTVATFQKTVHASKGQQFKVYGYPGGGVLSGDLPRYTIFGERRLRWTTARLATTSTITLSGEQTIDGFLTSSDVVLVKNQGDTAQNGPYVSGAGAWTRLSGYDTASGLYNAGVYVTDGTNNGDTSWRQTEDDIELEVTAVSWVLLPTNDEHLRAFPDSTVQNYFRVTADTTFRKTNATGFLLHDTAAAILNSLIGGPRFYSEMLGGLLTNARQYDEDGCAWHYMLTKGLQLRGYSLEAKPFFMSFDDWWSGANPIFNLGLAYEHIEESVVIPDATVVEDLEFWSNTVGGPNPGTWSFTSPSVPHVSVNGSGGVSGYAEGSCPTTGGETYEFSFELEIFDTGVSGEITEVTVAILDGSGNELDTRVFNYTDAGVKTETFTLTPASDGTVVAMHITNNTPIDTKSYQLNVFQSEDDAEPIVTPEETRIRVEKKSYFYDEEISVNLDYCELEREYDQDVIYKKITNGYSTWKAEDISGIDDPQTIHTYSARFKKIGAELDNKSSFIAASLAIESTRRQSLDLSTDYKFDDNNFIISVNPNDVSPDAYTPELNENFSSISNLLNAETRYNPGLTPARNFLRWQDYYNIAMEYRRNSSFKFSSAEGNYDMESAMIQVSPDTNCDREAFDGNLLSEKQDIPVTRERLHSHRAYNIRTAISWDQFKLINENRRKAIGISQTDTGHVPFFIKSLKYEPCTSKVTITAWPKNYFEIEQLNFTPIMDCFALVPDVDVNDAFDYDLDFDL